MSNKAINEGFIERERRNLLALSTVCIFSRFINISLDSEFSLFGLAINIQDNLLQVSVLILCILLYLGVTFYQSVRAEISEVTAALRNEFCNDAELKMMNFVMGPNHIKRNIDLVFIGWGFSIVVRSSRVRKDEYDKQLTLLQDLYFQALFLPRLIKSLKSHDFWLFTIPVFYSAIAFLLVLESIFKQALI